MARVRMCPTCGGENPLATIRCTQCGVSIAHISPMEAAPREAPPASVSCPHCEATLPSASTACPYCGESLCAHPQRVIAWPWGEQPLDQELIIGRDPDVSPLADRLAGYSHLSRRHARLLPSAEGVWIEDLGSANGVFVNEHRLTPHQPFLLAESGQLRLGKDFVMRVRIQKL